MEVKLGLSSVLTLVLGLLCLSLGTLILARFVLTADPIVHVENPTSSEQQEEGQTEEYKYIDHSSGVSTLFEYDSEEDCVLGTCPTTGAESCQELKALGLPSGYYWLKTDTDSTVRLFCSMSIEHCTVSSTWTRVALLNMSDPSNSCPKEWNEITSPRRTCGRKNNEVNNDGGGCSSAIFKTYGQKYTHIYMWKSCGLSILQYNGFLVLFPQRRRTNN